MRLKEIKPGMVIQCNTSEERKILLEELEKQGYVWPGGKKPTASSNLAFCSIHVNTDGNDYILWSGGKGNIEFSDLIIPELSAKEVLEICNEICSKSQCGNTNECLMMGNCFFSASADYAKVVKICEQWKAGHSKKEPETEWVSICRIIEIMPDGRKRVVCEQDIDSDLPLPFDSGENQEAERILKDYVREHEGEYFAVAERICRVKR